MKKINSLITFYIFRPIYLLKTASLNNVFEWSKQVGEFLFELG